jgi:hypothetical protein
MNQRVAIIAPYSQLRREAEAVVAELGANVRVLEGDLNEGVVAARLAVQEGAEVIISRGGTAMLISQSIDIPVVEIEVSPFDIIRSLMKLKEYRGPIGISAYHNVIIEVSKAACRRLLTLSGGVRYVYL